MNGAQESFEEQVRRREAEGWKKFHLYSYYFGNHAERGHGSIDETYLFHPSIDFSRWVGVSFTHGTEMERSVTGQFYDWLEEILEDLYMEI